MIYFDNLSSWPDEVIQDCVEFSAPERLKSATVVVSDIHFDFEEHLASKTFKDVNEAIEWDGLAFLNDKVVYVHLKQGVDYPLVWWVNEKLPGSYMRGMCLISPEEYFIYCIAHELRHLEQMLTTKRLGRGFKDADDEMDADLYAIIKLNEWRRQPR